MITKSASKPVKIDDSATGVMTYTYFWAKAPLLPFFRAQLHASRPGSFPKTVMIAFNQWFYSNSWFEGEFVALRAVKLTAVTDNI